MKENICQFERSFASRHEEIYTEWPEG